MLNAGEQWQGQAIACFPHLEIGTRVPASTVPLWKQVAVMFRQNALTGAAT